MNFFETFQKVAKPAKMKRQTKKITMGTHVRSGPFLPRKALWNGKNKFYQIVSFYTPMDAEFHDEQLLLKNSKVKTSTIQELLAVKVYLLWP